jgi:serine/threonine protein kinase
MTIDEASLIDLLVQWQESRDRGDPISIPELCRDQPELVPELSQRVALLRGLDAFVHGPDLSATAPTVRRRKEDGPGAGIPPMPFPPGAPSIPGYDILSELGRGGMGVVYRAWDVQLRRAVALKMLHPGRRPSAERLARLRAEAQALARLQHPHIVQVFTIGEHNRSPFLVLELVEGGSLATRLGRQPQPPREAARLLLLVARAVQAAHRQGIVHRDLKPSNILLGPPSDEPSLNTSYGSLKVVDFGIAKDVDVSAGAKASGELLGTAPYMAPEQARGDSPEVGPAADIYALGAVLYEMLTGRLPLQGDDTLDMLGRISTEEVRPPRAWRQDIPADLEAICLRCLARAPADRYPSARALADELTRFLQDHSDPAAPPKPAPADHRPRPGRRRAILVAAGLGLAALLPIAVSLRWLPWQKNSEPNQSMLPPLKGTVDVRVLKKEHLDDPPRYLWQQGVRPLIAGDEVRIEANLNRPAYVYFLQILASGKVVWQHPWLEGDWKQRDAEKDVPRQDLSLPVGEDMFSPLGAGPSGVESFMLLVRDEKLPAEGDAELAAVFANLPPQTRLRDANLAAWLENGRLLSDKDDPHRGPILPEQARRDGSIMGRLQKALRDPKLIGYFPYTRAVCYGFQGD